MNNLKPCPCGCEDVRIEKHPLWNGSHGYHGCYEILIKCANPNCCWKFNPPNNDTIYRSEEEAEKNVIAAWNRRK